MIGGPLAPFSDRCKSSVQEWPKKKYTIYSRFEQRIPHLRIKDAESSPPRSSVPELHSQKHPEDAPRRISRLQAGGQGRGENREHEREERKEPRDVSFAYHKLKAELCNIPVCSRK